MQCPCCGEDMTVDNAVDIGIGEIPFEWSCDCGCSAKQADGYVEFFKECQICHHPYELTYLTRAPKDSALYYCDNCLDSECA